MESTTEINDKIFTVVGYLNFPSTFRLRRFARARNLVVLALADICSLMVSVGLALGLFELLDRAWDGFNYSSLRLLLLVFWGLYALAGLYRSRGTNQVEELRLLTVTTTMIFLPFLIFNALVGVSIYPAKFLGLIWFFALAILPLTRAAVRWLGPSIGIWGEPVVVVGNGELSSRIIRFLSKNPYYGLRPVEEVYGYKCDDGDSRATDLLLPNLPIEQWLATYASLTKKGVRTAIFVASELPSSVRDSIAGGEHLGFSNIITVSKQFNTRNVGLIPLDFGGVLGLEERHYELNILEAWQIRILDLVFIILSLPLLAPLFLCIILAIMLDSEGGVFYRQTRIGKGMREFKVIKFRTMVKNADTVLAKYLQENPELLSEWKADHKLKDDPRITRVGKILRKLSLDELPQLWNVFMGEMSLVGPRPIVAEEIERYDDRFKYYTQVPPGLTGLWQVSGRNDVGYEQRVSLDEYYVRNRSIWFNLYILVRTATAVIQRQGAY